MKKIVFENLTFNRPGSIQIHALTDGLVVRGVKLLFTPQPNYRLLELGPKSATYKGGPNTDPSRWTEIFSPDRDCTVRNVSITGVRTRDSQRDLPIGASGEGHRAKSQHRLPQDHTKRWYRQRHLDSLKT